MNGSRDRNLIYCSTYIELNEHDLNSLTYVPSIHLSSPHSRANWKLLPPPPHAGFIGTLRPTRNSRVGKTYFHSGDHESGGSDDDDDGDILFRIAARISTRQHHLKNKTRIRTSIITFPPSFHSPLPIEAYNFPHSLPETREVYPFNLNQLYGHLLCFSVFFVSTCVWGEDEVKCLTLTNDERPTISDKR